MFDKSFICVANWKMNMLSSSCREYFSTFSNLIKGEFLDILNKEVDIAIAPPFVYLPLLVKLRREVGISIYIGAQNVHWEGSGAYTGEVSVGMLLDLGVNFAIVGHSERRQLFGETNISAAKRAIYSLDNNFSVIFCVGETLREREGGNAFKVVRDQLDSLFSVLDSGKGGLVIAYEPVWAIGTGRTAECEDIEEMHFKIKEYLRESYGRDIKVLYGGSVKSGNIENIRRIKGVDGVLVGGASLVAEDFFSIIKNSV